jgi:hypothetical protein
MKYAVRGQTVNAITLEQDMAGGGLEETGDEIE